MGATIVSYGEVLWDLLPTGAVLGGAPFNFAYRAGSLGHRGRMISRVGEDDLGRRALRAVEGLGLETGTIQRDAGRPTGTVQVVFDERRNPSYTIVPDVAYDFIEPTADLLRAAAEADCFCFGTLVQRSPVSRATLGRLLDAFRGRFVLLDLNLRKDCWDRDTVLDSLGRADILKLNEEEMRVLAGLCGLTAAGPGAGPGLPAPAEEPAALAGDLLHGPAGVSGLRIVVVTLGERGALAVARGGETVYHPGFEVELKDPIGSGDAFSAGFLHQLLLDRPLEEACRFGNALGAAVAAQEGATRPVPPAELERLLRGERTRP